MTASSRPLHKGGRPEAPSFRWGRVHAYAQEYGVSVTELGVDRIHLYVPTGHGVQAEDFSAVFRAAEITPADWREDAYVLSATPLTVDPDLLAPCDWRERARVAPDPAPEP